MWVSNRDYENLVDRIEKLEAECGLARWDDPLYSISRKIRALYTALKMDYKVIRQSTDYLAQPRDPKK